jgi:SAM-dependent methyltransferase
VNEWFLNEAFWRATYPFIFSEERFRRGTEEAQQALALAAVPAVRVLDVCCGPGRHTVAMAKNGLTVTGLDGSEFLLERAQERARALSVAPEFIQADVRTFTRPDAFDVALNLCTSFGYFDDGNDDRRVLVNIHQSLRAGGVFVLDMVGKELTARGMIPQVDELPDGSIWVQRPHVIDDWSRVRHDDIVIADGAVQRFQFTHRLYSGQEIHDALIAAGFADVSLFGDLQGRVYGPGATRLVAVGRKAK